MMDAKKAALEWERMKRANAKRQRDCRKKGKSEVASLLARARAFEKAAQRTSLAKLAERKVDLERRASTLAVPFDRGAMGDVTIDAKAPDKGAYRAWAANLVDILERAKAGIEAVEALEGRA